MTPAPLFAATGPAVDPAAEIKNVEQLALLTHYAELDFNHPALGEVILGPPLVQGKLWDIPAANPLTDRDPYFMRSQAWDAKAADCGEDNYCARKDGNDLVIGESGGKALRLKQPLHAILETQDYVILSPDDLTMFAAKTPGQKTPGEGFFYIDKADFVTSREQGFPVPLYFFPLPGSGWVGANRLGYENTVSQEITIYNDEQFGLPIETLDLEMVAKTQRNNLVLLKTEAFLNGDIDPNGVAYPPAHSTLAFGLFLSQPNRKSDKRQADVRSLERFRQIASRFGDLVLPAAHALDVPATPTQNEALKGGDLRESTENLQKDAAEAKLNNFSLKSWLYPGILYGGTGVLAALAANHHFEFGNLITDDIYPRLKTVGAIMGSTMIASVTMKYTIHKEIFEKKYPRVEGQSLGRTAINETKGIFDELAHGLYFTFSGVAQGMRHSLDYLKDRFAPTNPLIQTAWKETIEYDMRQNSKLAMNWKTFFYGAIIFGMSDAVLVGVDLAIFEPWIRNLFGFTAGAATAAFATAEIMRNFLSYLMSGAHSYSHTVKTMHMDAAMRDAKLQMANLGKDPEDARHQNELDALMNAELSKRYRAVGLPEASEFLYDPLTVLEKITEKAGFGVDKSELSDEQKEILKGQGFLLQSRHWGMVQPALNRALKSAERIQARNPSVIGAQVVKQLRWAASDRNEAATVTGRVWDTLASDWGGEAYADAGHAAVAQYLTEKGGKASHLGMVKASLVGKLKYLAKDSTQHIRDIRKVVYLMSNTGDRSERLPELFPESWQEHAGSKEASLVSAEMINRSLFALVQKDQDQIAPSAELEANFGARADAVLNKVAGRDATMNDPFVRQSRREELMYRLKKRQDKRDKLAEFTPKALDKGKKGAEQWAAIRDRATAVYDRLTDDDSAADVWNKVADRVEVRTGQTLNRDEWVRSYRYRLIVAREFTQEVGLISNGMEDSDFVPKVVEDAVIATEDVLKQKSERAYQERLSPEDREFYRAQVFAQRFRSAYVKNSVGSAPSEMSAASPEYPGIGQRVRRWLSPQVETGKFQAIRKHIVGTRVGRVASVMTRVFESVFRNEESAYDVGVKSSLERYVPMIPDIAKNGLRFARSMPYLLSFSYLTNYYIWQIQMPYALWTWFITAGVAMGGVIEMNHRFQRFMDIKPMDDIPSKLSYAWWHSRLTNPEIMFVQGTAQPVSAMINGAAGSVAGALMGCGRLLLGR